MNEVIPRRRTRVEDAGVRRWQVQFWDPTVKCWVDFGDPVEAAWPWQEVVRSKEKRCQQGGPP